MHTFCTLILALLTTLAGQAKAQALGWPTVKLPDGARLQSIAPDMIFNGRQTRIYQFEASAGEKEARDFFFRQFGPRTVERRVKDDLTIATRRGEFFVTLKLHVTGTALLGTLMLTRLSGVPVTSAVALETQRWLPPESRVISSMQSDDGGRKSLLLTSVNTYGVLANRDALAAAMQAAGFRVERSQGDEQQAALQLSSASEDAQVVIANAGAYRSVTVTRMRQLR